MLRRSDLFRRRVGTFCVAGSGLMLVWGFTALEPRLEGLNFVWYWLVCLSLACLAIFAALLDWWVISRRERELKRSRRPGRNSGESDGVSPPSNTPIT